MKIHQAHIRNSVRKDTFQGITSFSSHPIKLTSNILHFMAFMAGMNTHTHTHTHTHTCRGREREREKDGHKRRERERNFKKCQECFPKQ